MANQQSAAAVSLKDVYQVKADNANTVSHTGDTTETMLKSQTLPGGTLGNNGVVRVRAHGWASLEGGNKTIRLKFGSSTIVTIIQSTSIGPIYWALYAVGHNLAAENSQVWSWVCFDKETVERVYSGYSSEINTANDAIIAVTGQLVNGADQVAIDAFTVEVNPTE